MFDVHLFINIRPSICRRVIRLGRADKCLLAPLRRINLWRVERKADKVLNEFIYVCYLTGGFGGADHHDQNCG